MSLVGWSVGPKKIQFLHRPAPRKRHSKHSHRSERPRQNNTLTNTSQQTSPNNTPPKKNPSHIPPYIPHHFTLWHGQSCFCVVSCVLPQDDPVSPLSELPPPLLREALRPPRRRRRAPRRPEPNGAGRRSAPRTLKGSGWGMVFWWKNGWKDGGKTKNGNRDEKEIRDFLRVTVAGKRMGTKRKGHLYRGSMAFVRFCLRTWMLRVLEEFFQQNLESS